MRFQIKPSIVSEAFAKHDNMFFWTFNTLTQKLDTLLSYNISGNEILRGLSVFAINVDTMSKKLKLLSANKNEPISMWMLCCDKERFNR